MFSEFLANYVGQKVAFWCTRYTYRGTLVEVGEEYIVLENPYVVQVSGTGKDEKVEKEDPVPGKIALNIMAIENFMQPRWVHAE